jgi:hypothetical protein
MFMSVCGGGKMKVLSLCIILRKIRRGSCLRCECMFMSVCGGVKLIQSTKVSSLCIISLKIRRGSCLRFECKFVCIYIHACMEGGNESVTYIHINSYTNTRMHTYTHTHTHTYIHTYTQNLTSKYRFAGRNNSGWMKMKPEDFFGGAASHDCLIIGI